MIEPKYYTIPETCKIMGIKSRKTIVSYLEQGLLRGVKIGNRWKIDSRSLEYSAIEETLWPKPIQKK